MGVGRGKAPGPSTNDRLPGPGRVPSDPKTGLSWSPRVKPVVKKPVVETGGLGRRTSPLPCWWGERRSNRPLGEEGRRDAQRAEEVSERVPG